MLRADGSTPSAVSCSCNAVASSSVTNSLPAKSSAVLAADVRRGGRHVLHARAVVPTMLCSYFSSEGFKDSPASLAVGPILREGQSNQFTRLVLLRRDSDDDVLLSVQ